MSSDFLAAGLWIRRGTTVDFDAGLAALDALTAEQANLYLDNTNGGPETDDEPEVEARGKLRADIERLRTDVESPHSNVATVTTPDGGWEFWFAGGISYGDSPNEVFDAINNLSILPNILEAMRFAIWGPSADEADDEADDNTVTCLNCSAELPTEERCEESEDGEHEPDIEFPHEPPEDDPTRDIRLELVVRVPNDGYDYLPDVGGRIERIMGHLLNDRLVSRVETRGRGGSGYAGDVTANDQP